MSKLEILTICILFVAGIFSLLSSHLYMTKKISKESAKSLNAMSIALLVMALTISFLPRILEIIE